MCRHLAYLGPPVSLADLLLRPQGGLLEQSWAPQDMRGSGSVNADGFGVGWFDGSAEPAHYRRAVPMWADASFADLAPRLSSNAVLAAIRNGTPGMPVVETACAPFRDRRWLFSHNGVVAGWPDSLAGETAVLPVADLLGLEAPTDSAALWLLARRLLREGLPVERVVEQVTVSVAAAAPGSRLNLLLSDGETVAASTWGHSLATRILPSAVTVSSEPFGDLDQWHPVPDRHLVVATAATVKTRPLTPDAPAAKPLQQKGPG